MKRPTICLDGRALRRSGHACGRPATASASLALGPVATLVFGAGEAAAQTACADSSTHADTNAPTISLFNRDEDTERTLNSVRIVTTGANGYGVPN